MTVYDQSLSSLKPVTDRYNCRNRLLQKFNNQLFTFQRSVHTFCTCRWPLPSTTILMGFSAGPRPARFNCNTLTPCCKGMRVYQMVWGRVCQLRVSAFSETRL